MPKKRDARMAGMREKAIAAVRFTTVSAVLVAVLQLIRLGVLAHWFLEPDEFGLMAMLMVVVGFARAFGDVGLPNAIIHRRDATPEQLSSLYWLSLAAGAALFLLVGAATPLVVALFDEPRLAPLVLWAALLFVIAPVGGQFQALLRKELRFDALAGVEVSSAAVGAGVAIGAAAAGQGVRALIWGLLAGEGAKSLLLFALGRRVWRPSFRFRRGDLRGYLRFGLYQMGERSANHAGANLDKLLVGTILGPAPLGLYSVVYGLMLRPVQVLNPIITRVAFPVFAKLQDDDRRLREGYREVVTVVGLFLAPVYAGLFVAAEPFLLFVLGEEWRPAIPAFRVLCGLGLVYGLANPVGSLLLAKGRADLGFRFNVLRVAVYAAAVVAGAPFGLAGIAAALLISTVAVLLPVDFAIRRRLVGMRAGELLVPLAPFLLLAAGAAAAVALAYRWTGPLGPPPVDVLALAAAGAGLYGAGLLVWRRRFVADLVRSFLGRPPTD